MAFATGRVWNHNERNYGNIRRLLVSVTSFNFESIRLVFVEWQLYKNAKFVWE